MNGTEVLKKPLKGRPMGRFVAAMIVALNCVVLASCDRGASPRSTPLPENPAWKVTREEIPETVLIGARRFLETDAPRLVAITDHNAVVVGQCRLIEQRLAAGDEADSLPPLALGATMGTALTAQPYFQVEGFSLTREIDGVHVIAAGPSESRIDIVVTVALTTKSLEANQRFWMYVEPVSWDALCGRAAASPNGVVAVTYGDDVLLPLPMDEAKSLAVSVHDRLTGNSNFVPVVHYDFPGKRTPGQRQTPDASSRN